MRDEQSRNADALPALPVDVDTPQPQEEGKAVSGVPQPFMGHAADVKAPSRTPRQNPRLKQPVQHPEFETGYTIGDADTAVRIAKRHAELLVRLKLAILDGNSELEHALACEVVGLPVPPEPE